MKRTTISLPDELAEALDREASRRRTSISEVVRCAIVEQLGLNRPRQIPFAGIAHSGHGNLAANMEEILAEEWAEAIQADAFNR
jgi:metal-responsive CopG/Arc/MetJ family transcriptional regulator